MFPVWGALSASVTPSVGAIVSKASHDLRGASCCVSHTGLVFRETGHLGGTHLLPVDLFYLVIIVAVSKLVLVVDLLVLSLPVGVETPGATTSANRGNRGKELLGGCLGIIDDHTVPCRIDHANCAQIALAQHVSTVAGSVFHQFERCLAERLLPPVKRHRRVH